MIKSRSIRDLILACSGIRARSVRILLARQTHAKGEETSVSALLSALGDSVEEVCIVYPIESGRRDFLLIFRSNSLDGRLVQSSSWSLANNPQVRALELDIDNVLPWQPTVCHFVDIVDIAKHAVAMLEHIQCPSIEAVTLRGGSFFPSKTDRTLLVALDDKLSGPCLPSLSQVTIAGSSLFHPGAIRDSLAKTAGRGVSVVCR